MKPTGEYPSLYGTFRNANFLKAGIVWCAAALLLLVLSITSSDVGAVGAGCAAVGFLVGFKDLVLWRRALLDVDESGITVGRLFARRGVPWSEIDCFTIRPPLQRTPLQMSHSAVDEARVILRDGSRLRIRVVQPWHGFTILSFWTLSGVTAADEIVDALNVRCVLANRAG